jgi:hypothetical protein
MYIGSALYVWQVAKLARPLHLGPRTVAWGLFNAAWPIGIWSITLMCLLEETPSWLLELLRRCEHLMPAALRSSLFLEPPALYPVCRLLRAVQKQEEERKRMISSTLDHEQSGLSGGDVFAIIAKRLERLSLLETRLWELLRSKHAVPTSLAAPLLDRLHTEAAQLEKVLEEIDSAKRQKRPLWFLMAFSPKYKQLREELEAVKTLQRRISAVSFASAAYTVSVNSDDQKGGASKLRRTPSY